MHLIVYAAAAIMVLLYCIQHQRWRLTFAGLTTLPLPLWYVAGRALSHSNETEFGYSPPSHLAVPALVAAVCIAIALLRPRRPLTRTAVPLILVLAPAVLLGALGLAMIQARHVARIPMSAIDLLRLKALTPFQLLEFINIVYEPNGRPLLSATVTLLHRSLFWA